MDCPVCGMPMTERFASYSCTCGCVRAKDVRASNMEYCGTFNCYYNIFKWDEWSEFCVDRDCACRQGCLAYARGRQIHT